jgi:hypothetical protein
MIIIRVFEEKIKIIYGASFGKEEAGFLSLSEKAMALVISRP